MFRILTPRELMREISLSTIPRNSTRAFSSRRVLRIAIVGVLAIASSGCSLFLKSVDLTRHIEEGAVIGSVERRIRLEERSDQDKVKILVKSKYPELVAAISQIKRAQEGGGTATAAAPSRLETIPPALASSPVMAEIARALSRGVRIPDPASPGWCLTYGVEPDLRPREIGKSELEQFAATLSATVLNPRWQVVSSDTAELGKSNFLGLAIQYLKDYFNGDFIDGAGVKLMKPTVSNGVSDDAIAGMVTVTIEAAADALLKTPVFANKAADSRTYRMHFLPVGELVGDKEAGKRWECKGSPKSDYADSEDLATCYQALHVFEGKETWSTKDAATPTGAKRGSRPKVLLAEKKAKGQITHDELKVIRYLSGLAGDQAKTVAGLVLKSIGGVDVGPVFVLGQFSFGNNSTLMKTVEAIFEGVARRVAEHTAYELFKCVNYSDGERAMVERPKGDPPKRDDADLRAIDGALRLLNVR
jgi:hypothetical protein